MAALTPVVLSTLLSTSLATTASFPPCFMFGASSAAYQIEGAWNVSGKGQSIWDEYVHTDPSVVSDLSNGDVACDSYHQWERDVEMAAELGLDHYRFSLSWSRILPTAFSNNISASGLRYYNNLIDGLLAKGIEPMVTLTHFDLPQILQDLGGWINPLTVQWYASYARVVFRHFGDRVKYWLTFNEPSLMCDLAYNAGGTAPGIIEDKFSAFICTKNILTAHATVFREYKAKKYDGKMSLSLNTVWYEPLNASTDQKLTKLTLDYMTARFAHPIYSKEGGWPQSVVDVVNENSLKEGYGVSRLPELTETEIEFIKGTYDFFGINFYTCRLVRAAFPNETVSTNPFLGIPDLGVVMETDVNAPVGASTDTPLCPTGLRQHLAWIKEQYGDVEIMITENGYSTSGSNLHDPERSDFIKLHLEQVLFSMNVDKVNVIGYTHWSLMDSFEWGSGCEIKFGLYEVDFNSTERTRTARDSAYYYKSVIQNHSIIVDSMYDKYFTDSSQNCPSACSR